MKLHKNGEKPENRKYENNWYLVDIYALKKPEGGCNKYNFSSFLCPALNTFCHSQIFESVTHLQSWII